ncbi:DsbA family oxidoreductase [Tessaracoccus sp. G1721]
MSLNVSIWSDIACPWCYIGKRRFESALARFPQREEVKVQWRSYQLDPSLPDHDHRSEVEYLVAAKGMPAHAVQGMIAHVTEQAAGEGLDYDFDALVVANSRRAHRVLQAAKRADAADGGGRTDRLKEALLSAHFEGGRNIGDVEVLTELADAAGLPADEARGAVDSEDLEAAVERDIAEAAAIGVRGVPFFVFDDKYGVSGAQPPEVFLQALEVSWSERTPSLITIDGGAGEACGPDGCA